MAIYTANQWKISVSVTGVTIDNKTWDSFEDGNHTMDTQNYNPGGMAGAVATAGVSKRDQGTVARAWDDTLIGAWVNLEGALGNPVTLQLTPLKTSSTTAGSSVTYTGILRQVTRPNYDSTSSTINKLSMVVELNEQISQG